MKIQYDLSGELMAREYASALPNTIIKSIRTSSQLPGNYRPENLIDKDYKTAWVEGVKDSGVGEWIEIEFNHDVIICGMTMLNGYTKSIETFITNNKVASYEVQIKTKVGEDFVTNILNSEHFTGLKNKSYHTISSTTYYTMLDQLFDTGTPSIISNDVDEIFETLGETTEIKITISGVHEGTKYDDTCISELMFYGIKK